MEWWHLYIIIGVAVAALAAGFIFLRRRMKRKMDEQQSMVNQHKVSASILILEKRKDKIANANIPKNVIAQIPRIYKIRKVPLIKAKIGAQVMDLLCDEAIFDKLPEKKTVQVDLAGIFIAGIKQKKK
jgi:LPXTG-motif cell wall-anchored protein